MEKYSVLSRELKELLSLRTEPVAFMRLEDARGLEKIDGISRIEHTFTFCQALFRARTPGQTVGIEKGGKLFIRCSPFYGLMAFDDGAMKAQASMLATTWFANPEEALEQIKDCPRIPDSEAVVVSPLRMDRFEPEVVMIFGNPAQIMMIMSGMQKEKYELFQFNYVGEGACTDSLARCYQSGKAQLAVPCFCERGLGQVADDEIVLALPPKEIKRAISGIKNLGRVGFKYPIASIGGLADPLPMFSEIYGKK